ncbi:MAG: EAL domain-containing protein [Burkholderiaceae bacterium]
MALPALNASAALSLSLVAGLLAVAAVVALVLAHTLRKLRSHDAVVAVCWGLGGALAVGTGLWALQLTLWFALQGYAGWFRGAPLLGAWGLAVGTLAGAFAVARWLPSRRVANGLVLAVMLPLLALLYFVLGSAMAEPPRWQALGAASMFGALAVLAGGLGCALAVLNGPPQLWLRHAGSQRGVGAALFGLSWVAAAVLGVQAVASSGLSTTAWRATVAGEGSVGSAPVLVDALTLTLALSFSVCAVALAGLCTWVDSRSSRRAQSLSASLQAANKRLRSLAYQDALTALPNRAHFEERMERLLPHVGRAPASMAVLFIDIDGFKAVNESFGHAAGDEVLQEVGQRLAVLARSQDTAARIGGDEFLLLLAAPGSQAAAATVAQRTLHTLISPYALPNGQEVRLSCSIGIAMFPEHGPIQRLISNADSAMFAVKRTGGSTYAFFEPRMELDASDQLALQNDLRQAIEDGGLSLYYQPKIDALSGEFTGVEALVRWQHAVRGAVAASELIAVAERFGLIGAVGEWVFNEACRQLRAWDSAGLQIRVAVNLSAHQLRQDDLVQRLRATMARHRVDATSLTFEITESVAMEDTTATLRSFAQLARAGASLAIDDFGTGHSSLAYLRTLPARQLKIDRSFVSDLGQSGDAMAVVDAVIRLAHALGLRVVAEGVETERQRDILQTLGCDEFQGYLFARPMNAERLALWAAGEAGARSVSPFVERRTVAREPVPPGQRPTLQ